MRNAFCSMFPDREMVGLSHPGGPDGKGDFPNLSIHDKKRVSSEFFNQTVQMYEHNITMDTPPKQILGQKLNGEMLALLIELFV